MHVKKVSSRWYWNIILILCSMHCQFMPHNSKKYIFTSFLIQYMLNCAYLHKLLWVWLLLRTKRLLANGWEKLISILYLILTSTGKRDENYKKFMFWPYLSAKQTSGRQYGSDILTFNEKNKNFSVYFFPRCFVYNLSQRNCC